MHTLTIHQAGGSLNGWKAGARLTDETGRDVAHIYGGTLCEQWANMLAAAPALFEALDLMVNAVQGAGNPGDLAARLNSNVVDKARAAIALGKGK